LFIALFIVCATYGLEIREPKVTLDPYIDFVEGFLTGLNEKGDVNQLLKCVKNIEPLFYDIMEALSLILKLDLKDIMEGLSQLINAIREIIDILTPCSEGFEQLKKFGEAIRNVNLNKIIAKIIQNIAAFIKDIMECFNDYNDKDYYDFGKDLGDIMFRLFLQEATPEFEFDDFVKFVEGLLEGMGHGQKFKDIENCLEQFPEIYKEVAEAIKLIKELDWKNIFKLYQAIIKLIDAVKKVFAAIKPCSTAPHEIEEMINKLLHINLEKLLQKIISNSASLIVDFMQAVQSLKDKKFLDAGKKLGDILYLLVFKD